MTQPSMTLNACNLNQFTDFMDVCRLDMMGYAAALNAGFDQTTYDLNVLFMPKCWGQPFAGIGWVGVPGCLQNSQLSDYDASVAHELVR